MYIMHIFIHLNVKEYKNIFLYIILQILFRILAFILSNSIHSTCDSFNKSEKIESPKIYFLFHPQKKSTSQKLDTFIKSEALNLFFNSDWLEWLWL